MTKSLEAFSGELRNLDLILWALREPKRIFHKRNDNNSGERVEDGVKKGEIRFRETRKGFKGSIRKDEKKN